MNTAYSYQVDPVDSICQGVNDFSQVLSKISSPDENNFIFQCKWELKTKVIHYRRLDLSLEEKAPKQLVEKEAKKSKSSTSSMQSDQEGNCGKSIIEYHPRPKNSSTLDALMRLA